MADRRKFDLCQHVSFDVVERNGMPEVSVPVGSEASMYITGRGDFGADFECAECGKRADIYDLDKWWDPQGHHA